MTKHTLPLGTKVAFEGDSFVYQVADYQTLLGPCAPDCPYDDCYDEPYITVSRTTTTALPLSKLRVVFDSDYIGHPYVKEIVE